MNHETFVIRNDRDGLLVGCRQCDHLVSFDWDGNRTVIERGNAAVAHNVNLGVILGRVQVGQSTEDVARKLFGGGDV